MSHDLKPEWYEELSNEHKPLGQWLEPLFLATCKIAFDLLPEFVTEDLIQQCITIVTGKQETHAFGLDPKYHSHYENALQEYKTRSEQFIKEFKEAKSEQKGRSGSAHRRSKSQIDLDSLTLPDEHKSLSAKHLACHPMFLLVLDALWLKQPDSIASFDEIIHHTLLGTLVNKEEERINESKLGETKTNPILTQDQINLVDAFNKALVFVYFCNQKLSDHELNQYAIALISADSYCNGIKQMAQSLFTDQTGEESDSDDDHVSRARTKSKIYFSNLSNVKKQAANENKAIRAAKLTLADKKQEEGKEHEDTGETTPLTGRTDVAAHPPPHIASSRAIEQNDQENNSSWCSFFSSCCSALFCCCSTPKTDDESESVYGTF